MTIHVCRCEYEEVLSLSLWKRNVSVYMVCKGFSLDRRPYFQFLPSFGLCMSNVLPVLEVLGDVELVRVLLSW